MMMKTPPDTRQQPPLTSAQRLRRAGLAMGTAVLIGAQLSACAPLVLGTAVGGALMATDRRTSGALVEDKGINIKSSNRISEILGDRGRVSVNAYNRKVLLTGEVPTEADRTAVAQTVAAVENVSEVINEVVVGPTAGLGTRSSDALLASKVRATLIDARDLMSNAFDVVVSRGDVYLMGIVTEREADSAAQLTARISGVQRVIKVFEFISEDELARRLPRPEPGSSVPASDSTPAQPYRQTP